MLEHVHHPALHAFEEGDAFAVRLAVGIRGHRTAQHVEKLHSATRVDDHCRGRKAAGIARLAQRGDRSLDHGTGLRDGTIVAIKIEEQCIELSGRSAFAVRLEKAVVGHVVACGVGKPEHREVALSDRYIFPGAVRARRYDVIAVAVIMRDKAAKRLPLAFARASRSPHVESRHNAPICSWYSAAQQSKLFGFRQRERRAQKPRHLVSGQVKW